MHNGTTITQFIIEEQRHIQGATGEFTSLLNDIVTACKVISNMVNHGELIGVLGTAGSENVQGETQKKMDIISNEVFMKSNEWAGHLSAMASEEMDDIYPIPDSYPRGKYLLTFDPLDGSSNIDVNVSVGTIFSILKCPGDGQAPTQRQAQSDPRGRMRRVAGGFVERSEQPAQVVARDPGTMVAHPHGNLPTGPDSGKLDHSILGRGGVFTGVVDKVEQDPLERGRINMHIGCPDRFVQFD